MLPSAVSIVKCLQYKFMQILSHILLPHTFHSKNYYIVCQMLGANNLLSTLYCILVSYTFDNSPVCNCNKCAFISEIASKTKSTRETIYHMRQISRMLRNKGKSPNLGKLDETNQPVIGTLYFLCLSNELCLVYFYHILLSYTCNYSLTNIGIKTIHVYFCRILLWKKYSNFCTQNLHFR